MYELGVAVRGGAGEQEYHSARAIAVRQIAETQDYSDRTYNCHAQGGKQLAPCVAAVIVDGDGRAQRGVLDLDCVRRFRDCHLGSWPHARGRAWALRPS